MSVRQDVVAQSAARRLTTTLERPEPSAVIVMRLLGDPAIRRSGRLCLIGLVLMGVYVACFNVLVFRLSDAPFNLAVATISGLFMLSATGVMNSPAAGHVADHVGRKVTLVSCLILTILGLVVMTEDQFWAVAWGLGLMTAAFFAAHGVATGWVSLVAGTARSHGSALYLSAFYTGSAVVGSFLGQAYEWGGWAPSAGAMALLLVVGIACTLTIDAHGSPRSSGRDSLSLVRHHRLHHGARAAKRLAMWRIGVKKPVSLR